MPLKAKIIVLGVIFSTIFTSFCAAKEIEEKQIIVIIPSYNNERWCIRNIDSVLSQIHHYTNFHVYFINDNSTDRTLKLVKRRVEKSIARDKVTIIDNKERKGALANLYGVIHATADNAIIATIDGDDWLSSSDVLKKINMAYQDPNVWITYGQFWEYPNEKMGFCRDIDEQVIKDRSYRSAPWVTSHLRTFYAWLFKKIKREDLQFRGKFLAVTWDQAFMLPMLEMADGRCKFISEILYIYNQANPLNDFKQHLREQIYFTGYIRSKPKYDPI